MALKGQRHRPTSVNWVERMKHAAEEREPEIDYSRLGPAIGHLASDSEFNVGQDKLLLRLKSGLR